MSFAALNLHPSVLKAVEASGYTVPTPVQASAIPLALSGADLLVSSQTGSGKTAAFLLPSIQRLLEPSTRPGNGPRVLILSPTRELATQIHKAADTYGSGMRRLRTVSILGGSSYSQQMRRMSQPLDIMVATPGRLIDYLTTRRIDLGRVEVLVLDEADRMLDMGFSEAIEMIMSYVPKERQTMLFSATLDGVVGNLANKLTRQAQRVEIAAQTPEEGGSVEQRLLFADDLAHKTRLLDSLLRDTTVNQALVFTATKRAAEDLSDNLREQGFDVAALHGDMHQGARNRTLRNVREGRTRILVATDVAARGIDVAGISHVINFDLPRQVEDYVHRIGRTGRAGRSGVAVSLAAHRERAMVRSIERYTGKPISVETIPGLEPKMRAASSAPARRPGGGASAGAGARTAPGHQARGFAGGNEARGHGGGWRGGDAGGAKRSSGAPAKFRAGR